MFPDEAQMPKFVASTVTGRRFMSRGWLGEFRHLGNRQRQVVLTH